LSFSLAIRIAAGESPPALILADVLLDHSPLGQSGNWGPLSPSSALKLAVVVEEEEHEAGVGGEFLGDFLAAVGGDAEDWEGGAEAGEREHVLDFRVEVGGERGGEVGDLALDGGCGEGGWWVGGLERFEVGSETLEAGLE